MRPDKILEEAAKLFRERNAFYGDTYTQIGDVLTALQLEGTHDYHRTANRQFLVIQIANKLTRYCALLPKGGHKDSARDIIVYAAMLEEMTDEMDPVLAAPGNAARTRQTPQANNQG